MKTKTALIPAVLLAGLVTSQIATADRVHRTDSASFTDTAKVISVEPVYYSTTTSRPRHECWEEEVFYSSDDRHDDTALRMIVGGAIGGALGHNIGRHSDSAKIAGAVIGSAIGYDTAQRHRGRHKLRRGTEERCQTVYEEVSHQRLDGYRVTYRYRGQTFTTITEEDPGKRLRIRITLTPLD
jgi:uncharacterized protein YcfJ